MNKLYWHDLLIEAADIAVSIAAPGLSPVLKVIKFGDKHLTKGFKKSSSITTEGWKIIAETLKNTLDGVWTHDENPVKNTWKNWEDTLNLIQSPKHMADTYDLFNFTGRSFIYDLVSEIAATLYNDPVNADKKETIKFARLIVNTWKKNMENARDRFENSFIDKLQHQLGQKLWHEFDWAEYKFYLRWLPYKEIMKGLKMVDDGIQAIYVPPDACEKKEKNVQNPKPLKKLIEDALENNWNKGEDKRIIGIYGGPGMGKSSFSKMFAAELCEKKPDVYPLLVRLRVLRQAMTTKAIETWIDAIKAAPYLQDPDEIQLELDKENMGNRKTIIILDGLDELNIGGTGEDDLKQLFDAQSSWFLKFKNFNIIVTSRPLEFIKEKDYQKGNMNPIFEIQLFDKSKCNDLIDKFKNCNILPANKNNEFIEWIEKIDKHNPEERKMSGQPLLLYLLANVFDHAHKNKIDLKENLNRTEVYKNIVKFTLERTYDNKDNKLRFKNAGLEKTEDAERLLQEVAFALYQMGRDYAKPDILTNRLEKVEELNENFPKAIKELNHVLIAFHIGESEQGGVEFIHKSIAEYLTAKAITRRLNAMCIIYCVKPNPRDFAKSFIDLFGMRTIDGDLVPYLVDLFDQDHQLIQNLLLRLQEFINGILDMSWLNKGYTNIKEDLLGFEARSAIACLRLFSIIAQTKHKQNKTVEINLIRPTKNHWELFLWRMRGGDHNYQPVIAPAKPIFEPDRDVPVSLQKEQEKLGEIPTRITKHGIDLVYVPGGQFEMGDLWGDGNDEEKPVHRVELDGFYMGKYQVTNAQYARFLNEYGSDRVKEGEYQGQEMIDKYKWGVQKKGNQWQPAKGYDNHPVVYVTWYGAYEFCRYYGFQLPTEAQWEYAARSGGKKEKWSGTSEKSSLTNYAWYDENSDDHPHEVGTRLPNGLGLHDMSGNVWEWCQDWYDGAYYQKLSDKVSKNPVNTNESGKRVPRGGSWYLIPWSCRVAYRFGSAPDAWNSYVGFRVVCFVAVSKTP